MKHETVSISTLAHDPRNVRKHSARNIEAVRNSLKKFGQQKPIVVQEDGTVIAGNATLEAARALGWDSIDIVRTTLIGEAATAFAIADNRTAELAMWDEAALHEQLKAMTDADLLLAAGFDSKEFAKLASANAPEVVEDVAPEPPAEAITKPGDLWLLGKHRVLCGDSTKPEDVARLMDGKTAQLMFTDPPYGIDYEGGHFHSGNVKIQRKREHIEGDHNADIYASFLSVVKQYINGACYIWFAGSKGFNVYKALHESGYDIHSLIIWNKINAKYAAMNSQYKPRHEPCIYCKPKGTTLRWCGLSTEATVWDEARDAVNDLHPTQKPVRLAAKAINNHDADTVLDVFLGSGSTLIAAEQLGRACYGMELSPTYCDVIVKRWETLTGQRAELSNQAQK